MERDMELWALFRAQESSHDPALLLDVVRAREAKHAHGLKERRRAEIIWGAISLLLLAPVGIAMDEVTIRIACALLAAALAAYGVALFRYGRSAEAPPSSASVADHFTSYRKALERELVLLRHAVWYVLPVLGSGAFLAFSVMRFLREFGVDAWTVNTLFGGLGIAEVAILALSAAYNVRMRRGLTQQIAALTG